MKKGIFFGVTSTVILLACAALTVWSIVHWKLDGWLAALCYLPMLATITCMNVFPPLPKLIENPESFLSGWVISSVLVIVSGSALWWFSELPMVSPDAPNWRAIVIAIPFFLIMVLNFRKRIRQIEDN